MSQENRRGASPANRDQTGSERDRRLGFATVGILIVGGIIVWGFLQSGDDTSEPVDVAADPGIEAPVTEARLPETIVPADSAALVEAAEQPAPEPEPVIETDSVPEPEPAPPTLSEANVWVALNVDSLNGGKLGTQFVASPNPIERGIAMVDNLRQGEVPYKFLPLGRPKTKFPFRDNGLGVTLDSTGFQRYDGVADAIEKMDMNMAADIFRQFQPAIEEGWNMLGYEGLSVEDALMGALSLIITAPGTDLDARLFKVEANWLYEDPDIESLPGIQKQLMRMGPTNAAKIQSAASALRGALLDSQT